MLFLLEGFDRNDALGLLPLFCKTMMLRLMGELKECQE